MQQEQLQKYKTQFANATKEISYQIWFLKEKDKFFDCIQPKQNIINKSHLSSTHISGGIVKAAYVEDAYNKIHLDSNLQKYIFRTILAQQPKEVRTIMLLGDILKDKISGECYILSLFGFKRL